MPSSGIERLVKERFPIDALMKKAVTLPDNGVMKIRHTNNRTKSLLYTREKILFFCWAAGDLLPR